MNTFQDFETAAVTEQGKRKFILDTITEYKSMSKYVMAVNGERYYKQDTDIKRYQKFVYNALGQKCPDIWSANNKISSNYHFYFTVQAIQCLLGNGVTFTKEDTKEKLGKDFDYKIQEIATHAKNGSCGYGLWNYDHIDIFSYTEFIPLYDENTSELKAGIRFWRHDIDTPMRVTLYEIDGKTEYVEEKKTGKLIIYEDKKPYIITTRSTRADGAEVISGKNYKKLPIVPLFNINKKSDLDGNKDLLDAIDLLTSGLVNNVSNGEFTYWVLKNAGGFDSEADLQKFVDRLNTIRVMTIGDDEEATPHTVETPYEATEVTLKCLVKLAYHNYMALDVEEIKAGNVTATQIEAAYEPLTEKTDLFEYQVTKFINGILELAGIDDEPSYVRSFLYNKTESIENLLSAAEYLDEEFVVKKLCSYFDCPEEAPAILDRRASEAMNRLTNITDSITGNDETDDDTATDAKLPTGLNGAQTQSLLSVIENLGKGILTEGQAIDIISVSVGISKDEARRIVNGN